MSWWRGDPLPGRWTDTILFVIAATCLWVALWSMGR